MTIYTYIVVFIEALLVRFPLSDGVFQRCGYGLDFDISLRENCINQY